MQSLILIESLANGSKRTYPLSRATKITVQAGASYTVIDANTGKAPADLTLQREGDVLKVVVDKHTVAHIDGFYDEGLAAEFTRDGTVAMSDDVLISGGNTQMTGASSGDGGSSFLTVAGSIALGTVIGGGALVGFKDYKDNDGGDDDVIVGRETALVDPAIVVFDLISGESSSHSGRTFDANIAYTIIIVIDSEGEELVQPEMWSGAQNLGSDDVIILVGSGAPILGNFSNSITDINFNVFTPGTVSWATGPETTLEFAAFMFQTGEFHNQIMDEVDLWEGTVPGAMASLSAFGWANSLPEIIRNTQGL